MKMVSIIEAVDEMLSDGSFGFLGIINNGKVKQAACFLLT